MKQEIAEKWVERLRSGKITQCTSFLGKTTGARCCLGVLSDLAVEEGIIPKPVISKGCTTVLHYGQTEVSNGNNVILSKEVIRWAGMKTFKGSYEGPGVDSALSQDNDSGKSFSEIADIIEEHRQAL